MPLQQSIIEIRSYSGKCKVTSDEKETIYCSDKSGYHRSELQVGLKIMIPVELLHGEFTNQYPLSLTEFSERFCDFQLLNQNSFVCFARVSLSAVREPSSANQLRRRFTPLSVQETVYADWEPAARSIVNVSSRVCFVHDAFLVSSCLLHACVSILVYL